MKNKTKLHLGLALVGLALSCAPELNEFEPKGSLEADFTEYIAIGNSLTAGFSDGGLYLDGQKVAYPNLIAEQLQKTGAATDFNSPFFNEQQANGSGFLRLKDLADGQPVLENISENLAYVEDGRLAKYAGKITNLGVPGMRLDMAYSEDIGKPSDGNMYFERLLTESQEGNTTYLSFSVGRDYSFFTFWLGNNDVLGYATNGAVEDGPTSRLTDLNMFSQLLGNYIQQLTSSGQKGAIATIPDVTSVPYFTTVTKQALLTSVNATNPPQPVSDIYITTKRGLRAAADKDMFVLPFSSAGLLGVPNEDGYPYGLHPLNPVEDKYVLDTDEASEVAKQVNGYNSIIKAVAEENGLALVDAYTYLNKIKSGLLINDIPVDASFITGNAFSLDGIHLTPLGNAIMANLFIEAINNTYEAHIPKVDVTKYRGVKLPN